MKKQLFTLALLTFGYVASSHSAGTLALVYMTNIDKKMAAGTTQKVNAIYARIKSETPKVHGQSVLRLEETEPGKWLIITENPGTATIVLEKKVSGYSIDKKLNTCEHDITVTAAKDKKGKDCSDKKTVVSDDSDDDDSDDDDSDDDFADRNRYRDIYDGDSDQDARGVE